MSRNPRLILASSALAVFATAGAGLAYVWSDLWARDFSRLHHGTHEQAPVDRVEGSHYHHHPQRPDRPTLHGHHGNRFELGSANFGEFEILVVQVGELSGYTIATVEFHLHPANAQPASVSAWIGDEQATGTLRSRVTKFGTAQGEHTHLAIPSPLPSEAALWIAYTDAAGQTQLHRFEVVD